jgi:hypothetical protein
MSRLIISAFVAITLVLGARAAEVQVQVGDSKLPMFRPALVGNGPAAIINTIDTKALMQQGQKNAEILFSCSVGKTGDVGWSGTYRGTPGSELLEKEVLKRLDGAKFIPAVYNHQQVEALFYGAVLFAIVDGKPRLRIFSNQEVEDLKNETDFIAPQPFMGSDSGFTGFHYPDDITVQVKGVVELKMKVSATGVLEAMEVATEDPPLVGFGDAAMMDFAKARFIPGFRGGKPVESTFMIPVFFHPR